MNTYSHALLAAAFKRPLDKRVEKDPDALPPVTMSALIVGSFIPDFLLTILSIAFIIRDMIVGAFDVVDFEQLEPGQPTPQEWLDASLTLRLFDVWFFENPWVITIQQLFHSPLLLIVYIAAAYWFWKRNTPWAGWFFWLSIAAMFHTLLDIPLHVDDGPLLLFPLNWSWRFISPISYWDPEYYGREWTYFETALDIALIIYFLWIYRTNMWGWLQRRFRTPA
ncbi:MAG: metal-dependent hydrolase [Chloroflexota bacterium]